MYIPLKNIIASVALSLVLFLSSAFAVADDHADEGGVSAEVGFFYHNKYIDEGARELEDGGIFSPSFTLEFEDFHIGETKLPDFYVGGWWAVGDDEDFTETNLFIGKVFEWNNYSLDFSYTWLNTDEEEEEEDENGDNGDNGNDDANGHEEEDEADEDHELLVVFSCEECIPFVTPEIGYVYSTEADGGAVEIELSKEIEMGSITLEPFAEALIDFGYVTDEYDGLNHIVVGLEVSIPIHDQVNLEIYGAHSFAEENIRREGGEDHTWGGIGLEFEM